MKKLIVGILALTTTVLSTQGGPVEVPGDQKSQAQASYQATSNGTATRGELDLFGTYAFTSRPYQSDRYLRTDHAWGGGIDANYMFTRYFGVGVEGYGLAAEDAVGAGIRQFDLSLSNTWNPLRALCVCRRGCDL